MTNIVYLPRLDLPPAPSQPVYYVNGDRIDGIASIYMHTPGNQWWKGGKQISQEEVPVGMRRLGVEP